jgi:hypothetical protein
VEAAAADGTAVRGAEGGAANDIAAGGAEGDGAADTISMCTCGFEEGADGGGGGGAVDGTVEDSVAVDGAAED